MDLEHENPRLCLGTFFITLMRSRRRMFTGSVEGLASTKALEAFLCFIAPSLHDMSIPKEDLRAFLNCEPAHNLDEILVDPDVIAAFDKRVREDYRNTMVELNDLICKFLDRRSRGNFIFDMVLRLILMDTSIHDPDIFFVCQDGKPLQVKEFFEPHTVFFSSFVLGVTHFIVKNRPDNHIGFNTVEIWNSDKEEFRNQFIHGIPVRKRAARCEIELASVREEREKPGVDCTEYLRTVRNKYSELKTLLYTESPKPFYDFYVCNDLTARGMRFLRTNANYNRRNAFHNVTAEVLTDVSQYTIITGMGGLGKSMMMRHLLLSAVDMYNEVKLIPIFVPLKDYSVSDPSLESYVYKKIRPFLSGDTFENFKEGLEKGEFLLLLDGLDEIHSLARKKFEDAFESFVDRFDKCYYVVSSRPDNTFVALQKFDVLQLLPFTKAQALGLIDKLDFRPDEPQIKEKFREELDKRLYSSHREFTENPLLLTIMLMTYEQFAEIPSKMHVFYHDAFMALAQRHDASKGGYRRDLRTKLPPDRFADYFSEFCARTYRDEMFELSEEEMTRYFGLLKEKERHQSEQGITASDFIYDLTSSVCLMYYESGKYHFTHRSFQEYFCAVFFSKQKDKTLGKIGEFFEKKSVRTQSDNTFAMLYDMIPDKVDEYIILPYLTDLFSRCDEYDGYWTYLENIYGTITYNEGDVPGPAETYPRSFLFRFIVMFHHLHRPIYKAHLEFYEEFITDEFVYVGIGEDDRELLSKSDLEEEFLRRHQDPDVVGWTLQFNVRDVVSDEDYRPLLTELDADTFPYKQEYILLREYYEELKKRQEVSGPDLFDLF